MLLSNILLAMQSDTFSRGVAIALAGLLIVFVALILISLFIATLPHTLGLLAKIWPEVEEPSAAEGQADSTIADDAHVLAAIGFVLHTELQHQLAAEQASVKRKP